MICTSVRPQKCTEARCSQQRELQSDLAEATIQRHVVEKPEDRPEVFTYNKNYPGTASANVEVLLVIGLSAKPARSVSTEELQAACRAAGVVPERGNSFTYIL